LRQYFGLGQTRNAAEIEIRWPGGQVDKVTGVDADQFVSVLEARGLVSSR
jgi:ASPIC/UnbV protein